MHEGGINWTDQQKRAIGARGSDVLVTASAGTGKTAVLSGRCVSLVSDRQICADVLSVLVLTFTDAAAEQMRLRIAGQFKDAYLSTNDLHLRHQLLLLQAANISTIHSFCKRLITEHFYKLGLDPTFAVIDADEARLLKTEILEKTIRCAWERSDLVPVLGELLSGRDLQQDGFLQNVIRLSDFLETVVSRENWYGKAGQLAATTDLLGSSLGRKQKDFIEGRLTTSLDQLRHARRIYEHEIPGGPWVSAIEGRLIRPLAELLQALQAGNWTDFVARLNGFDKSRFPKPKDVSGVVFEVLSGTKEIAVDCLKDISSLAILNPEYLDRFSGTLGHQTMVLVELVKKFDEFYGQAKKSVNCLDFADLEHYALRLLSEPAESSNDLRPSETALALRRRYRHIFVDEYQDINAVQQTIIDMLSSGNNVFGVGDVKQSIYAWRGAQPQIFLRRLEPASSEPAPGVKRLRVDLNTNFRSTKPILDFINRLFGRIMTRPFAGVDYDSSAHLHPAVDEQSAAAGRCEDRQAVEIHILDEYGREDSEADQGSDSGCEGDSLTIVTSRQRQAALIAQRIKQMVGAEAGRAEFQTYDKRLGCMRDVEYRDIVVLMRSLAKKANEYVEILRLAGVPVSCQSSAGYFEATEVTDMLSLLKVLDNPQRDIELAAVLRSPIFGISDGNLARIQVHGRGKSDAGFYDRIARYVASGQDCELGNRLRQSLEQIEAWRTFARRGNLAELIWGIYRRTGYLSFVSALPSGQARRANLLKLHDRAIQFEGFASSAGVPSLTRFVQFVEKLQETGQDWAPAEPESAAGNAVRILSVHKSKGLEFPVVFLAELNTRFNKKDAYGEVIADADYTLGLQIIDADSNSKVSSLAHQVIAEQKLANMYAEEMRILYVATTRAKERLIVSACEKREKCRRIIANGFYFGDRPVPDWQLRASGSPLEWLLYSLSDQKVLHETFETGLAQQCDDDGRFSFRLHDRSQLDGLSRFVEDLRKNKLVHTESRPRKRRSSRKEPELLAKIKQTLIWQYPFFEAPHTPAKTSVSELSHANDEYIKFDYSNAVSRLPVALAMNQGSIEGGIGGRTIGSATHLVISRLDISRPPSRSSVEQTIEGLLADGVIPAAAASRINIEAILGFFSTDIGQVALHAQSKVFREWPFTFALPASELSWSSDEPAKQTVGKRQGLQMDGGQGTSPPNRWRASDETIVVQGIIDMLIQTPDGLIVIDFKTDDVTAAQVRQRAELYRTQVSLYCRAASGIVGMYCIARCLYFLNHGEAVCF
jgi:ATP-dependent helicase/nuclease subunit A